MALPKDRNVLPFGSAAAVFRVRRPDGITPISRSGVADPAAIRIDLRLVAR